MKKIFHHPPEPETGKKYWRSLSQRADTPEFRNWLEREFPAGAEEFAAGGVSRRNFLKLMGASTALAGLGLGACRRPEKHLVPFTKSAEWAIPGKPLFYATSMPSRTGAQPLIVTTHDGRPTKIEGNRGHPSSGGATGTYAQACLLNMYDPDRSGTFLNNGNKATADDFDKWLTKRVEELSATGGEGLAFLLEQDNSPTRERLRDEIFKKYPKMMWAVYEPLINDEVATAHVKSFGDGVKATPAFERADVILSLDCDFLGGGEENIDAVKGFMKRRRVNTYESTMNRLYVVENRYTPTGGMADHRLRLPVSQIGSFVLQLAEEIGIASGLSSAFKTMLGNPTPATNFDPKWLKEMAKDLVASKGRSIVIAGSRQPAAVHLLVNAINDALGNIGRTIVGSASEEKAGETITDLSKAIHDKTITTLFILGGNPVYNAPADLEWEKLQNSIQNVVRLGLHEDETSSGVMWHVPAAHFLESWGDGIASNGGYVSVQPMILPLFGGWSELDIFARLIGQPKPQGPELVQETFKARVKPADFAKEWNRFLHDGFVTPADKAPPAAPRTLAFDASSAATLVAQSATAKVLGSSGIELVFPADSKLDDGRYANNGWMQELPDPITKLTWDNAASMSMATAKSIGIDPGRELGKQDYETIDITVNGKKVTLPVLIAPGHADNSITIPLGYGRAYTGRIAKGVGVNVYPLRTTAEPYFTIVDKAAIKPTGRKFRLAITQDHHSMEGRAPIREATIETYKEKHDFAKVMWMDEEIKRDPKTHQALTTSLYEHPKLDDPNQWGMAVDLNTCTGCNACVIACQAENNIPIVGKEQVVNGRSMHWIRNDRYFASVDDDDSDPEMLMQPMMCQQCENAPCETVCPVNATVHSRDGLNVMAYNRCIGTRYCANNCPFKVRRFNFFDYQQRPIQDVQLPILGKVNGLKAGPLTDKGSPDTLKMQKNPNVTVRMRGVMEKCTFCVQRIEEAKIAQRVRAKDSDNIRVPTDSFMVACQQVCAADAIVFGDIKDPNSRVSQLRALDHSYRLLEYLNVNSRVTYLARLRNPNPAMPDAATKDGAFEKKMIPEEEKKGATEPAKNGGEE